MNTDQRDNPEPLDLASLDVAGLKRQELLELFPEVRTEGGKIDFERLKAVLGETVDVGRERYGMNWPGKADCMRAIQAPSLGTLLPKPEESMNWDTTENSIIEGDNLEVLKLLQKSYLGRVKMIYIDPPYNTGHEFIYPDNFGESLQTYLQYTGQVDVEGRKFSANTDSSGRFHSKWLNMMLPRLYLARNLLSEDGVIFISIDDSEVENLKKLCNEVFGEENFIACVCWQKKQSPQNDATYFSDMHDFILVYAKMAKQNKQESSGWSRNLLPRTATQDERYKNPDNDPRGAWTSVDYTCNKTATERPNLYYPIRNPITGEEIWPSKQRVWRFEKSTHEKNALDKRIWWGSAGEAFPRLKRFRSEVADGIVPTTWWTRDEVGDNQESRRELRSLFGEEEDHFDTPKPVRLIQRMLQIATTADSGDIVMDFFAGSGTTGEAVLKQNHEDGGNRRYILVQLPEPIEGDTSNATIAGITRERMRRCVKRVSREKSLLQTQSDVGFRSFTLAASNFIEWDGTAANDADQLAKQLQLRIEHVRTDRTQDDLLFEILLKSWGDPALSLNVGKEDIAGKQVFSIADGAYLICLDDQLTLELIRTVAHRKPDRVIFKESAFEGNDQLKTNAVQSFKAAGVTSFKVV